MAQALGFKGRVAIVTGSSKGIGRAYAELFAARGAQVVVNGRGRAAVAETVAAIKARGDEAIANIGDVSTEAGANALIAQTLADYGRIDIVVNNAGILNFSPFEEMSAKVFNETMAVNLGSAFYVTRAAWPYLIKQGYGRVLTSPSQGVFGAANVAHYSASKGACIGLLRTLSLEGKPHGINVNGIIPFAYTDMYVASSASGEPLAKEGVADVFASAPKLLDPKLVAPAVAWLCHESCDVTGEMVHAGGGRFSRVFMAETPGFFEYNPTPESVRDNWSTVCEEANYIVPRDTLDPLLVVMRRLGLAPAEAG